MHEGSLQIYAQHDAKPYQRGVFANDRREHDFRNRREQRDDNKHDLEEIQKEGNKKYEQIDEYQESPDATRETCQPVFQPRPAVNTLKDHRETRRANQDEDHHGSQACGRFVGFLDQVTQFHDHRGAQAQPYDSDVKDRDGNLER